jgi:hypothetical protein
MITIDLMGDSESILIKQETCSSEQVLDDQQLYVIDQQLELTKQIVSKSHKNLDFIFKAYFFE